MRDNASNLSNSEREARLDAAIAEYMKYEDAGVTPARAEFLARYPDLASDLANFLDDQAHFRRIINPFAVIDASETPSCPQCECLLDTDRSETTCATCGWRAPQPPTLEDPFPSTHQLGRIKLADVIGRGGFGTVYKGWDTTMRRPVAVKVLRQDPNALNAKSILERFLRESKVTAQLDHPGIVRVYDVGQENGVPYIVSEFIEGRTLESLIQFDRPTPKRAAKIVVQIANALHHAHQKKVIHRDVKPSNILMRNPDEPLVTDFGLAFWECGEVSLTEDQQVLGTLRYMSPEQARGDNRKIDCRADVYSIGVLLYALLSGEVPFTTKNKVILSYQIDYEEPRSPRALDSRVPRDLETICLKCLRKEPANRYATAAELAEDLQRYLDDKPVLARPINSAERFVLWVRRNRTLAASGAMAILLLLTTTTVAVAWAIHANNLSMANKELLDESRLKTAEITFDNALIAADRGDVGSGMLGMARSLEFAPESATEFKWMNRANLAAWRGQLLALTDCHQPPPGQIHCVTPDGKSVWFVGPDLKTVRRWNLMTGQAEGPELKHSVPVSAIGVSPDGRRVATGCVVNAEPVRLWDVESGSAVPMQELRGEIRGLYFLSDSQGLMVARVVPKNKQTGEALHTAFQVWNTLTRQPLGNLVCHPGRAKINAISQNGKSVFVSDLLGKTVWNYDVETGHRMDSTIRLPMQVTAIAANADGRYVLVATADRIARLYEIGFDQPRAVFHHRAPVSAMAFGAGGQTLSTISPMDAVRVWEGTDRLERAPAEEHTAKVRSLAVSLDGKKMASGDDDRSVRISEVIDGKLKLIKSLPQHASAIAAVTFSPDGRQLATSTHQDEGAMLWETSDSNDQGRILLKHPARVHQIAFSSNGKRIATAGYSREVWLWTEAGEFVAGPLMHGGDVRAVVFSPDGHTLLTGCNDGAARRFDSLTGQPHGTPLWHSPGIPVQTVAFSPNGRMMLTAGDDGAICRWDTETGARIGFPVGHEFRVRLAVFSPDSKVIMTGGLDFVVKLWDANTGLILGPPLHHTAPVREIAIAPSNRWAISASEDGTACIWSVRTCRAIGPRLRHNAEVHSALIEPKGQWVITAGFDKAVRVWPAPLAIEGEVNQVTLWNQVLVGAFIDEMGNMQVLDPAAWRERRNQLQQMGSVTLP